MIDSNLNENNITIKKMKNIEYISIKFKQEIPNELLEDKLLLEKTKLSFIVDFNIGALGQFEFLEKYKNPKIVFLKTYEDLAPIYLSFLTGFHLLLFNYLRLKKQKGFLKSFLFTSISFFIFGTLIGSYFTISNHQVIKSYVQDDLKVKDWESHVKMLENLRENRNETLKKSSYYH